MIDKRPLTLKLNRSFQAPPDAPFTPVEQTLQAPVDAPNNNSYFGYPSLELQHEQSFLSNAPDNDSDDILTDADEPLMLFLLLLPMPKALRNYTVSFTSAFDQILMDIFSRIMLLPTTTPFLGCIPPLGIASRVANETLQKIISDSDPMTGTGQTVYDLQSTLDHEQLRNTATTHIVLQLIRKRLLDICSSQKPTRSQSASTSAPSSTSIQVSVSVSNSLVNENNPLYSAPGLRQLSMSTLLLSEHNTANCQQNQPGQGLQSSVLAGSRLHSSSLDLRKQSLTRNNSLTSSSWLHVGNVANVRSGGQLGLNSDMATSSDSLQLMNDFVPHALTSQGSALSASGNNTASGPVSGFNPMMMDYQTPPSSSKSSFSHASYSPSGTLRETACYQPPESADSNPNSDSEINSISFMRSQSLSRGGSASSFPKPLTINTDTGQNNCNNLQGYGDAPMSNEMLHSPFVSAVSALEDFEYFGHNSNSGGNTLEKVPQNVTGSHSGPLGCDCLGKDGNKVNLPHQSSLNEKKRDSLKLKRGIH